MTQISIRLARKGLWLSLFFMVSASAFEMNLGPDRGVCYNERGIPRTFYIKYSKCIENRIYDIDQELCDVGGGRKLPYYPSSYRCEREFILHKDQLLCDIEKKGFQPYYKSQQECINGKLEYKSIRREEIKRPTPKNYQCAPAPALESANSNALASLGAKTVEQFFINKAFPTLSNPAQALDMLSKQYKVLDAASDKRAHLIQFADLINTSYQSNSAKFTSEDLSKFSIEKGGSNFILDSIKNGTACVSHSASNPSEYTVNLYALRKEDCINITRYTTSAPHPGIKSVFVNYSDVTSSKMCAEDIRENVGSYLLPDVAPNFLLGQNHIVINFSKY